MLALGALVGMMFLAIPIFAAMGIAAAIVLYSRGIDLISIPQSVFETLDSFVLIAVPLFVLAGNIMKRGGIAPRLISLAIALLGWVRGGLSAATVLTCMFFSTLSGSSSATTAAVGGMMIPAMHKRGYPKPFATAVVAVGGELGAILPPSLPMIIYGLVTNVSIGALFLAGILPGLLVSLSLIATVMLVATFRGFDKGERTTFRIWFRQLVLALRDAVWALMMPLIILGGIYSGIFTPVEASGVAVAYGLVVGVFVYREIGLRDLVEILNESALTTGIVMLIVAFAALFGYVLTISLIPQSLARLIGTVATDPILFLLLVNLLLFVTGTFLEAAATILILGPILAPLAATYGIHPVHFGMIMIVNVASGMVTPPVAINLSIASQISGVPMDALVRPLLVFLLVLIIDALLISFLPGISLVFVE